MTLNSSNLSYVAIPDFSYKTIKLSTSGSNYDGLPDTGRARPVFPHIHDPADVVLHRRVVGVFGLALAPLLRPL